MELIPAIDIMDGKCVRLSKGDFTNKIIYSDDPVAIAESFADAGLRRLHIVDLDGAKGSSLKNISVLEAIAKQVSLVIDYGGGIKTTDDITTAFNAGASLISVGSISIKNPGLFKSWINKFGTQKFLPGADVLDKKIYVHGWTENTDIDVFDHLKNMMHLKINTVFCTDISRDGMMKGPATDLYKDIRKAFPALHLIASGGISCYEDLVLLQDVGCSGAIIGKAFYEGKISLTQMGNFINE